MTREEQIRKAADDYCGDDTREQSPCFYAHIHNAFLEGVAWADSHPQWIPVEEELPKENQRVLTYNGVYNEIYVCDYENGMFEDVYGVFHDGVITHWMPMPMPPQGKEANNER